VTSTSFVQTTVDDQWRGRVIDVYLLVVMGMTPLGAPMTGAFFDVVGVRAGLAPLGGISRLSVLAVGLLGRFAGRRNLPSEHTSALKGPLNSRIGCDMKTRSRSYRRGDPLDFALYVGGHLSQLVATEVVAESELGLTLRFAIGAPMWKVVTPNGVHLRDISPAERPQSGYDLTEGRWSRGNALVFQPVEMPYAVWSLFDDTDQFSGWYVNFERRIHDDRTVHVLGALTPDGGHGIYGYAASGSVVGVCLFS
jgi:hypothetical protein